jgi:fumarate reductase flavoprotein subunit
MEILKTDLVILGAGGAGMCAAVDAADAGARVIVFEKRPFPGGNTNMAMGALCPGNERRDTLFREFMEFSHWRANARLVRAYVDKSVSLKDWVERHGIKTTPLPSYSNIMFKPGGTIAEGQGGGASLIKSLVNKAKQMGVDFRFSISTKKIVTDGGRVTGVIAEDESGKTIRANAKAVIIATGGFGNNKEMIKEHTGFNLGEDMFVVMDLKMTGDGIRLAWEAGAAKEAMGMHLIYSVPGPGIVGPMPWMVKNQVGVIQGRPYLWVNQQGERFFDESVAVPTFRANAIARQKGRCAYLIFDGGTRKSMEEKGFDHISPLFPGNERLVDFDAQIKGLQDSGNKNVFVADTLEGLAQKMGIKLDALQKTVDEYNRFCEKGHDDLFAKDPKFLRPVKVPKFFAFRIVPSAYGTLGGIKVNERMEVLNKEQDVIPGLYAAGYDANIMYGDTPDYNHLKLAGSALGFALNSGRIAGENAARYIAG